MDDELVGKRLGKYQIQGRIGRGGMGTVYLGYDPLLDRRVAIKVLAPHLVWEEGFVERFLREARAAARLKHPHIVTIYDVGQEGQCYYFVMEFVAGQALSAFIGRSGPLPSAQVIALLRPLAAALDYAHGQGLIHRDVKPANVIVGPDGHVTLTDFGIARAVQDARLTSTGTLMGTPEYMSPEQVQGAEIDARTDLYSLAIVAFEMLSGQTPFGGTTPHGVLYKQVFESPPPICRLQPGLPPDVEGVLARALAKAPDSRYPKAAEFVEALSQALAGSAHTIPPVPVSAGESPTLLSGAAGVPQEVVATAAQPAVPAASGVSTGSRPPPSRSRRLPAMAWVVIGLVVIVAAVLAVLIGLAAFGGTSGAPVAGGETATRPVVLETTTQVAPASPVVRETPGVLVKASPVPQAQPTRLRPTPAPSAGFKCGDPQGCVLVRAGEPIRIGLMLVVSGNNASLGIDARRGAELAVRGRPEVVGHPIELVLQDSLCTAEGGRAAAQKLAADPRLVAVVGPSCSSEAHVAIPILCQAGVALVSPSSTSPDLTGADRPASYSCFLRTAHNDVVQAAAAAHYAREVLKAGKAATIHDGGIYSDALQQMFADQFERLGGVITSREVVPPDGGEVTPAVNRTIRGEPDLVFAPLFVKAGAAVARTMSESDSATSTRLILADASFSADWLRVAGPAAVGTLFTSPDLTRFGPRYHDMQKNYLDTYGQEPVSVFHAQAYDAAAVILTAIENVAVLEPDGTVHIPRRALIEALYATHGLSGITGNLSCSPAGDCAAIQISVYEVVNADPASWSPGANSDSNPRKTWP